MAFSAGQIVTAADLQDLQDGLTPVEDNSIATAAANFTVTSGVARTIAGGKIIKILLNITSTNAITATSGNIGDVTVCTIDAAYRPTADVHSSIAGTGSQTGEAILNTNGTVVIRSLSDSSSAGAAFRMDFTVFNT